MTIQVLVATVDQDDCSLVEKMNLQTDAIIGNQCSRNEVVETDYKGHSIKWFSFNERGVGLNRNNALMRANADIVMFADDDMIFVDNYDAIVKAAFQKIPQADVIIFDLKYADKPRKPIKKVERLTAKKCMRFGTARISAKLNSLRINGISFNLCFGGGAQFSSGEDSLFLMDCIRHNLKIYSFPAVIAELDDRASTWFSGYNDKFFFDKGVLFSCLFHKISYLYAFVHCFKKQKRYAEYGWYNAYKRMVDGIKSKEKVL